jgi:hypothetical protein
LLTHGEGVLKVDADEVVSAAMMLRTARVI